MTYIEAAEIFKKKVMCDRVHGCCGDECSGCPNDYNKMKFPNVEDLAIKALEILADMEEK